MEREGRCVPFWYPLRRVDNTKDKAYTKLAYCTNRRRQVDPDVRIIRDGAAAYPIESYLGCVLDHLRLGGLVQ